MRLKVRKNRGKVWTAAFLIASLFVCACTKKNATEITQEQFTQNLEQYGVELLSKNVDFSDTSGLYGSDIGSERYDILTEKVQNTNTYPSSKETTFGYFMAAGEIVENMRYVSTADKTPAIYKMQGNVHYKTGKCSNVCALKGTNIEELTIQSCIFENMSGISLYGCKNVVIENCYFKGAENGIYLAKCENIIIKNCTFEMNATGLTDYYQGVYLGDGNIGVSVQNAYFQADEDIKKPFRIGSTSREDVPSYDITFSNCVAVGLFRSGFQNIDGTAILSECIFIFERSENAYNSAVVIDVGDSETHTTLKNCTIYAPYRKKLSTSPATAFENCKYGLL